MSPGGGPSPAAKAAAVAAKMPATQRQRRYDQVMGDKEPDVTDKKFVHELQTKLENKYYESQQAKEKQLADSEKKRIRKLVMEGVVESDEKRLAKNDNQPDAEWKEFWPPNPNKTLEEYEEEKRRAEEKHQKEAAAEEQHRRESADDSVEAADETGAAAPDGDQAGGAPAAGGGGGGSSGGDTSRRAEPVPLGKYTRAQSARIVALQDEDDLEQLYQKASELVYIMAPVPKAKGKAKH